MVEDLDQGCLWVGWRLLGVEAENFGLESSTRTHYLCTWLYLGQWLTCRGWGWNRLRPLPDVPDVWDKVLWAGSPDTGRLWRTQSLVNTTTRLCETTVWSIHTVVCRCILVTICKGHWKIQKGFYLLGLLSSVACASSSVFSIASVRSLCFPMTV